MKIIKLLKNIKIEKLDKNLYFIWIGSYTTTAENKKNIIKKSIELMKLNKNLIREK